jgi:hypothetical protein
MTNHDRDERPLDDPDRNVIAPGADPVEPRDPTTTPVPSRRWKAVLYAIPAVLFVVLGIVWMLAKEPVLGGPADSDRVRATTGEQDSGHDPEGDRESNVLNPPPEGPAVISDVELLTGAQNYAGRPARFAAVVVAEKNGDRTFWVGRLGNRTLVLLDRNVSNPGAIQAGKAISLAGRIDRTPASEQLDRLGLSDEDRRAFEDEEVYIHATKIEPVDGDPGTPVTEIPREQRENK